MDQETLTLVIDGSGPKGDVLGVAELAGIMAAKRTAELIPLCHPLPLSEVSVEITPDRKAGTLVIKASAATTAQTGVEMEAMTAASVAALTVYDMVKSVDRFVTITAIRLLEKSGGASGHWRRPAPRPAGAAEGEEPVAPVGARPPGGASAPATAGARESVTAERHATMRRTGWPALVITVSDGVGRRHARGPKRQRGGGATHGARFPGRARRRGRRA